MSTFRHDQPNALINPVSDGDIIIAESGEKYIVRSTMCGEFWLQHILSGHNLTHPVSGQIGIIAQIDQLANI